MLRKILTASALVGASLLSIPAQAQVNLEFGFGPQPRYGSPYDYEPRGFRQFDDRPRYRGRRAIAEFDGGDCRIIVRRRVNRFGEYVVRRIRVCD
ncbi:hypothetical protein [Bosea sp. (in: a-proteobacteria)]|uniref:hypothetical protein n=1 Tax=Bosea sp. (in: a-proteobacteria) TaxID=1871050 RepID=UPI0012E3584E|nr:hypothetical protein [Bosea sp. (in: a-proteobacteria)]MDP3406664.1 hypothetical protein [Bosea sp. (in: a-proteobacteria)]